YGVDNSKRELHGALLDAEILADVYLLMTGGQTALLLGGNQSKNEGDGSMADEIRRISPNRRPLPVIRPGAEELVLHEQKLAMIAVASGNNSRWLREYIRYVSIMYK